MITLYGVPERELKVHLVVAATAHSMLRQVAGVHQVANDPVSCPFGDTDTVRDVAQPRIALPGYAQQHVRVVRQEAPLRHTTSVPVARGTCLDFPD